jgi:hypothetical protein
MFSILSIKPRNSNGKGKSTYGLNGNTIQTLLLVFQKATHTYIYSQHFEHQNYYSIMYVAYISIEQVVLENLNLTKQKNNQTGQKYAN